MGKLKVSVTVSPERLRLARDLTGESNISELVDEALNALVERQLERRWLEGYRANPPRRAGDLPGDVPIDLSGAPWEDS